MSELYLDNISQNNSIKPPVIYKDFRSEVEGGWDNVYAPIKERMDKLLTSTEDTVFEGSGTVHRSYIGFIFAHSAKLLGSPLVRAHGNNVKTKVIVRPTKNGRRCWHRYFYFPEGHQQLIQTTKVIDSTHGFIDAVGKEGEGRLATKMRVWTKGKSLFFESEMYFLRFKFFNIKIPSFFTPGTLSAEHRDEGDGWFRYILRFRHPLWGETFYQDGMFKLID